MLHLNTINEQTYKILLSFQKKDYLNNFSLAGGTSLSLRFGQRRSIDLDMFSTAEFNPAQLNDLLDADFQNRYRSNNKYMLFTYINEIKTDWIYHPFPLLAPIEIAEGIRFFSVDDVAAMKLFAITKRGTKKDFFDIFKLLEILGPERLRSCFEKKYGQDKIWMMEVSLIYFDDADSEKDPDILEKSLTWSHVKKTIRETFGP